MKIAQHDLSVSYGTKRFLVHRRKKNNIGICIDTYNAYAKISISILVEK